MDLAVLIFRLNDLKGPFQPKLFHDPMIYIKMFTKQVKPKSEIDSYFENWHEPPEKKVSHKDAIK